MIEKDFYTNEEIFVPVVIVFNEDHERWGYVRHPEYYPYDYFWFGMIPKADREKNGGVRLVWKDV